MKIAVEVPVFGPAVTERMHEPRFVLAHMLREYDLPFHARADLALVFSETDGLDGDPVPESRLAYYRIGSLSYRAVEGGCEGEGPHYMGFSRDDTPAHPFFEDVRGPLLEAVSAFTNLAGNGIKDRYMPASFVAHLREKGSPAPYRPEAFSDLNLKWFLKAEKAVEAQLAAFDARMARFACVDGRLYVREDLPLIRIGGDVDTPKLEAVRRELPVSVARMNGSLGYEPWCFGYFDMADLEEARRVCAAVGGGWFEDGNFAVEEVGPGFRTSNPADLTVLDLAESMKRFFVRSIASMSYAPDVSFREVEEALSRVTPEAFSLYKSITGGIAASSDDFVDPALVDAVAKVLETEKSRACFFARSRHAEIAEQAMERLARATICVGDAVAA